MCEWKSSFIYLFFLHDYNFHFYLQLHILRSLFAFYFSVLLQMTVPGKKLVLVVSSPHYQGENVNTIIKENYFFYTQWKSLVTRRKGESQNGCYKKSKHAKFSEKRTLFVFREIWRAFFFCNTRFEIRSFAALLPTKCEERETFYRNHNLLLQVLLI